MLMMVIGFGVGVVANVLKEGRQRCLDVGMSAFLSKPAKPVKIIETIRGYLPLHKQATCAAERASAEVTRAAQDHPLKHHDEGPT
jgi:CheY-like chemotaxis protein